MVDLQNSTCPNCGSPLEVKPGDTQIKCAYCGSTINVTEHENSTPEFPQYSFTIDDHLAREIGTVGKVTAGIAISSIVIPIIIAVVVLCGVGALMYFIFSGANGIKKAIIALPTSTMVVFPTTAPTATLADTPTMTPTQTPFPTPVPYANVLFQDDFSSTSSGWDTLNETDYTLEYKDGTYHVRVGAQDGGQSVWVGDSYSDVSVEVDATQTNGPEDALVGVICRFSQDTGGYSFEFAKDGSYGIYIYDQGSPTALDENVLDTNIVNSSGINHIDGICSGPTLTLVLNGVTLMQVQDSTFTSGGAGVIVRSGYSGEAGIDVSFDQFLVKGP